MLASFSLTRAHMGHISHIPDLVSLASSFFNLAARLPPSCPVLPFYLGYRGFPGLSRKEELWGNGVIWQDALGRG